MDIIETDRLILRPMESSDVDLMYRIFSDPRVLNSFGLKSFDREQMERWVHRNLDHQDRYGYGLFSVILRSNGILIGDCGLERMDIEGEEVAELGYDFLSDYWNQGYATVAAIAVRDYSFNILGLSRLVSLIRVGNLSSRRVAEKVGMTLISEFTRFESVRYWEFGIDNLAL
jgi:RimJ/RimL family protein N-acetyltransferase